MRIPFQNEVKTERTQILSFRGYDKGEDSKGGFFSDMKNMSGESYPKISSRKRRGLVDTGGVRVFDIMSTDVYHNGKLCKDALVADCEGRMKIFYTVDGKMTGYNLFNTTTMLTQGEKASVVIGSKIFFFPDKIGYDLITGDVIRLEAKLEYKLGAQDGFYELEMKPCDLDGNDCDETSPYRKLRRVCYYLDDDGKKGDYKMDMAFSQDIKAGDTVKIGGFQKYSLNTYYNILNITENRACLVVESAETYTQSSGSVSISREVPDMDYVVSSGNRLWGCRYGMNSGGTFVNEIYASALGDPTNWYKFSGTATDSWTASMGQSGAFTGAVCVNGSPVFFKENTIIKVYGDYPSEFHITETKGRGIEEGSCKSAVFVNGLLYYKSRSGIVRYNEGVPSNVDDALGDAVYINAVAGSLDHKYYVSMEEEDTGKRVLFVYDTERGTWHKEDDKEITSFCRCASRLYFLCEENGESRVYSVYHKSDLEKEEEPYWMCETHSFGFDSPDSKYLHSLIIRLDSPLGTHGEVYVEYDGDGRWHKVANASAQRTSKSIRIVPRRCDSFKIRLCGKGDCAVRSISKTVEKINPKITN